MARWKIAWLFWTVNFEWMSHWQRSTISVSGRCPPFLAASQSKHSQCLRLWTPNAPVEKEGQNGYFLKALNWPFGRRACFAFLVECWLCRTFSNTGKKKKMASIRGQQFTEVKGRLAKAKSSISWVRGVWKRRPKHSLEHFRNEQSLENRLKKKATHARKSLTERNRTTRRFFDVKTSKTAVTQNKRIYTGPSHGKKEWGGPSENQLGGLGGRCKPP